MGYKRKRKIKSDTRALGLRKIKGVALYEMEKPAD